MTADNKEFDLSVTDLLFLSLLEGENADSLSYLEQNADVRAVTPFWDTPLHYAVHLGYNNTPDIVEKIIEKKPDVNAKNIEGETPLDILFKSMNNVDDRALKIANLLLQAGANPELVNVVALDKEAYDFLSQITDKALTSKKTPLSAELIVKASTNAHTDDSNQKA